MAMKWDVNLMRKYFMLHLANQRRYLRQVLDNGKLKQPKCLFLLNDALHISTAANAFLSHMPDPASGKLYRICDYSDVDRTLRIPRDLACNRGHFYSIRPHRFRDYVLMIVQQALDAFSLAMLFNRAGKAKDFLLEVQYDHTHRRRSRSTRSDNLGQLFTWARQAFTRSSTITLTKSMTCSARSNGFIPAPTLSRTACWQSASDSTLRH